MKAWENARCFGFSAVLASSAQPMRLFSKQVGGNCRRLLFGIGFALCLIGADAAAAQQAAAKFKTLDLSRFTNFPPSNAAPELVEFPSGTQRLAGVPFVLGGRVAGGGGGGGGGGGFFGPPKKGVVGGGRGGGGALPAGAGARGQEKW